LLTRCREQIRGWAEKPIGSILTQLRLLELSIQSLNGFIESIQILYAVDCGKGPLAPQQAQTSQVMSEIKKNKEKELYDMPNSDQKGVEEAPNTPTNESSSPFNDSLAAKHAKQTQAQ